jgi:TRAP transporter TAXI family solute receptor
MRVRKPFISMMVILVTVLSLILVHAGKPAAAAAREKWPFMLQGTTSTGSLWYALSVAYANVLNKYLGTRITPVASKASFDNCRRIRSGEFAFGTVENLDVVWKMFNGIAEFKNDAYKDIRVMWEESSSFQAVVVTKGSGVKKFADLQGKPYSPGIPGSGTDINTRAAFKALGIKPKWRPGGLTASVDHARAGRITGFTKGQAIQYEAGQAVIALSGAVLQLHSTTPITILSLTPQEIGKIKDQPWLAPLKLEAGVKNLPGLKNIASWWVHTGATSSKTALTQEQCYKMVKTVIKHQKEIIATFAALKGFDIPQNTIDFVMELTPPRPFLHAGTVQCFKEKGVRVPKELIPPEYKPVK